MQRNAIHIQIPKNKVYLLHFIIKITDEICCDKLQLLKAN